VTRELLSNVVRHSKATEAKVTLKTVGGVRLLVVSDNGVGLSAKIAELRVAEGHIGLASHRARIEASGGSMTIEAASPGTRVRVAVPLR
jgi:two-component system, NarL family, sensor kinase